MMKPLLPNKKNHIFSILLSIAFASVAALTVAPLGSAAAGEFDKTEKKQKNEIVQSEFEVVNHSSEELRILVFRAKDGACDVPQVTRTVPAGQSKRIACENKRKHKNRCKILVKEAEGGAIICRDLRNACDKTAIRMQDGSEITIRDNPTRPWSGPSCAQNQ